MNIAIILAAGIGSRIKSKIPKQFIKIKNKTILEYSLEKFLNIKNIDSILIVTNKDWIKKSIKIFEKHNINKNIYFCIGGNSRNESISKAIEYLDNNFHLKNNDVIITHDANRIFISEKIINENIIKCKKFKCVITGVPSIDTIYKFNSKNIIDILDRDFLFNAQTPQTFTFEKIKKIISNKDLKNFNNSDLGTLAFLNKEKIYIVIGSTTNFKITYNEDLDFVKKILDN